MSKLKLLTIVGIILTLIIGTLMHYAYEWTDNNTLVGWIAPVNESVWEHIKLVFFPMLFYSFYMDYKLEKVYPCISSSIYFGIILGTLLIPIIFYTYTRILGYNTLILDIGTFIISVIISYYTIYKLTLSCKFKKFEVALSSIVLLFIILFIVFTHYPPNIGIFMDPSH